jgi:1-acyl-sn-glycerol-3-phosphate acyltransferase
MQWIASLLFTTLAAIWTGLYALFYCIACPPLRPQARFTLARWWARSVLAMLRLICGLDYRIEGIENLPKRACISLWKHSSAWETVAMQVVCPMQVWVLKRELMWIPVFGWALALTHAIAIKRSAGAAAVNQVIEQGLERLAEGRWVIIFPEGTRMPAGIAGRYGVSGALLSMRSGAPIVPVAHDAGYYWPRRGLLKRRGQ